MTPPVLAVEGASLGRAAAEREQASATVCLAMTPRPLCEETSPRV